MHLIRGVWVDDPDNFDFILFRGRVGDVIGNSSDDLKNAGRHLSGRNTVRMTSRVSKLHSQAGWKVTVRRIFHRFKKNFSYSCRSLAHKRIEEEGGDERQGSSGRASWRGGRVTPQHTEPRKHGVLRQYKVTMKNRTIKMRNITSKMKNLTIKIRNYR